MRSVTLLFAVIFLLSVPVQAQRLESPEVHDDGSVTFRIQAADAEQVEAQIARVENGKVTLTRGDRGWWEGTSTPLQPGIYEYGLIVDGIRQVDPRNRWIKKWYTLDSLFEVPGDPPLVTQLQTVPHGVLHQHTYASPVTGTQRQLVVYTPPSYGERDDQTYPVLFLLHGFGDDETAWTEVGRTHRIADNLIASGSAQEMVIVMTNGHPVDRPYGDVPADYNQRNNAAMVSEIDDVLIPWIEDNYRVKSAPEHRAITGLSMGGGHSIRTALGTGDFAWVGAFSAAAPEEQSLDQIAEDLVAFKQQTKLFWIACGRDDFLLERNQAFAKRLTDAGVTHQYVETAGAHNWGVWRDHYLPRFLPMLFQH